MAYIHTYIPCSIQTHIHTLLMFYKPDNSFPDPLELNPLFIEHRRVQQGRHLAQPRPHCFHLLGAPPLCSRERATPPKADRLNESLRCVGEQEHDTEYHIDHTFIRGGREGEREREGGREREREDRFFKELRYPQQPKTTKVDVP